MSSLSAIIPVYLTDFKLSNGRGVDPCNTTRRKIINAVRQAFADGNIVDYNISEHSAEIKEKVLNFSSKQFKIANIKPSNKSYKSAPGKIREALDSKEPRKLGTSCGICSEGTEITIFVFQKDYPDCGIFKGAVFIDTRVQPLEPDTHNECESETDSESCTESETEVDTELESYTESEGDYDALLVQEQTKRKRNEDEDVYLFIKIQLAVIMFTSAFIILFAYLGVFVETDYQRLQRCTVEAYHNMANRIDLSFFERINSLESLQTEISKMDFSYFHYLRNLKTMSDISRYLMGNSSDSNKKSS